jgi:hypothetical protein
MRGKAVPQRMRRHAFLDPGGLGRGMDGAVELAGRERFNRIAARKQPAPRQQHAQAPALPPPGAQQLNPEYGSLLIGFCRRGVIYVVGKLIGVAVTA